MIRFFPVFSGGAPGVALLLLRITTSAALFLATFQSRLDNAWLDCVAITLGISLIGGFFTRVASALCAILMGVFAADVDNAARTILGLHGLQSIALALLGAGAYSVDARLFGRRVIWADDRRGPSG